MKIINTIKVAAMVVCCGCSKSYDVHIPVQSTDLVGNWVIDSAPQTSLEVISTNRTSLEFSSDGTARYRFFPIPQSLISGGDPGRASSWTTSSGDGSWSLADEGSTRGQVWNISLRFPKDKVGIQLTVGKKASKELVLIFHPDANSSDSVIFKRASSH
jgi:hypothetical protein